MEGFVEFWSPLNFCFLAPFQNYSIKFIKIQGISLSTCLYCRMVQWAVVERIERVVLYSRVRDMNNSPCQASAVISVGVRSVSYYLFTSIYLFSKVKQFRVLLHLCSHVLRAHSPRALALTMLLWSIAFNSAIYAKQWQMSTNVKEKRRNRWQKHWVWTGSHIVFSIAFVPEMRILHQRVSSQIESLGVNKSMLLVFYCHIFRILCETDNVYLSLFWQEQTTVLKVMIAIVTQHVLT